LRAFLSLRNDAQGKYGRRHASGAKRRVTASRTVLESVSFHECLDARRALQSRLNLASREKVYRNSAGKSDRTEQSVSVTIRKFVSDTAQAKRYFVSGMVQGVGYRFFAQRAAEKLHLCGFVRNLRDGGVEVYAIGSSEQLAQLRSALERGPRFSSVTEVREETAQVDSRYTRDFSITYDE
jgi:acylphosphatase